MQGNITCVASHHFNDEETVMCVHRVPDFVNGSDCCIHGCVKAYGYVSARHVFIYSAGKANAGDIKLAAEFLRSPKAAITTNNHQSVDTSLAQICIGLLSPLIFQEFFASCRLKDGTAPLNYVSYRPRFHLENVIFKHSLVAPHDAVNFKAVVDACADNCPYCRIHTRGIPSRCENSDPGNRVRH